MSLYRPSLTAKDDTYNVYDRPMRPDATTAVYRPTRSQDAFNEDEYEKLVCIRPLN